GETAAGAAESLIEGDTEEPGLGDVNGQAATPDAGRVGGIVAAEIVQLSGGEEPGTAQLFEVGRDAGAHHVRSSGEYAPDFFEDRPADRDVVVDEEKMTGRRFLHRTVAAP